MPDMTERQMQIHMMLEEGMSAKDIATELAITRNAVYQQIQALKKKGILDAAYTPTGEVRVQRGRSVPQAVNADALLRVIESQQATIAQQADTCAKLAEQLGKRSKNR